MKPRLFLVCDGGGTLIVAPIHDTRHRVCCGPHVGEVRATVEVILDSGAHEVLVAEWCAACLATSDLYLDES